MSGKSSFSRVFVGGVAGASLVVASALPASGGTGTATTAGWTIQVGIADVTWTSTEGCELFPVQIVVSGWGAESWGVDMDVRHAQAGANSARIFEYQINHAGGGVDGTWAGDFQLCPWDPPGTYVASGTAEYGYDFDYTYGAPGTLTAPISTTFTLSKIPSQTSLDQVTSDGDVALMSGRAMANSPTLGAVGWGGARVSLQQYLSGAWQEIDYTYADALGYFSETVYGVATPGALRAVAGEEDKVLGSSSNSVVPAFRDADGDGVPDALDACPSVAGSTAYAGCPPPPSATVKVKAKSRKSKFYVDVNPNKGKGYWKFQVQQQLADGSWKAKKTYKTKGKKETRTINLKRGTYRVVVLPKYGYLGTTSGSVYLKK